MATSDKYDRQLRLWGAAGQRAVGETCVVLIRATAAGTETVKNLVLPGIGSLLVLDDVARITTEYASNFFLVKNDDNDNKPRAQVALELLQELNPDVQGSWKHASEGLLALDIAQTLQDAAIIAGTASSHPSTVANSSNKKRLIVIASDLEPPLLQKVSCACHAQCWSLVSVHSYGLLGLVRLQTPPLPLLEPKLRNVPPDLRLVHPFAALRQLQQQVFVVSNSKNENDDECTHVSLSSSSTPKQKYNPSHIPYPLILLQAADAWKQAHDGQLPTCLAEKQEFQARIRKNCSSHNNNWDHQVNYQEAYQNAYLAYAERELDLHHLTQLRDYAASQSNNNKCRHLHALLQALFEFLQSHHNKHHHQPPLHGTIPDMTASTELYVQLQRAYQTQAEADWRDLRARVPPDVPDAEVTAFCQNVHALDVLQTGSLIYNEIAAVDDKDSSGGVVRDDEITQDLIMATMEGGGEERPDQTPLLWYLGFRACQAFYQQHGRYPGVLAAASKEEDESYQRDIEPLHKLLLEMVRKYGLQDTELLQSTILKGNDGNRDFCAELTRYGNAEIHNIASVVGGVASQEAVKLITGQYVPLNNTFVYNGISSMAAVYKF